MRPSLATLAMAALLAACAPKNQPAPSTPATAPGTAAASGPPGSIGVACKAVVAGYKDYATTTLAPNLDICSVNNESMLSLYTKGEGADSVQLFLAGYHGAGDYPLSGGSALVLANRVPSSSATQSTKNCAVSACTARVTDASPGAPAGTPQALDFAVTCPQLCDADTHHCTTTPGGGGPVTWSFHADCKVR